MKFLTVLPLLLCLVQADSSEKQDVKLKTTSSASNTIAPAQKYEMYYPPIKYQQPLHQPHHQIQHLVAQKPQYVPVQLIPKQYLMPQPQPQAMIIIAQPALVPQSLLYSSPTQQLLNYFHSNPQAKYQFLHGNYQQQQQQHQQQPTYMHQVVASPSFGNYILAAAPAQYQYQQYQQIIPQTHVPVQQVAPLHSNAITAQQYTQQHQSTQHVPQTSSTSQQQYTNQQQPAQLSNIAHLAQLAAQQYITSPLKSAPAIVTGFENFTPEQQAQIKAQLSQHLGSNYHAISNNNNANTNNNSNQYSAKYVAEEQDSSNEFVPSPQIKTEMAHAGKSGTGDILKTMRVKERN